MVMQAIIMRGSMNYLSLLTSMEQAINKLHTNACFLARWLLVLITSTKLTTIPTVHII